MEIPESYILQKLFSCCSDALYRRDTSTYNASCPVCREGTSAGKKKRLFYYVKTKSFYCFNCNRSWPAIGWISQVCNLSTREIFNEINTGGNLRTDITSRINIADIKRKVAILPHDSINLYNEQQLIRYKDNRYIQLALETIKARRLDTAINKPKNYYISLTDYSHKNRLCIPFYDINGDIVYYQTRSLDDSLPKYLSKPSNKELYGLNNIKGECSYLFIFEGPIDAMFVQNGVGATGLNLTKHQQDILNTYPLHKKIWVTDNQHLDDAAKEKTDSLLKAGLSVFIWPSIFNVKDINALAVLLRQDSISHEFLIKNTVNL